MVVISPKQTMMIGSMPQKSGSEALSLLQRFPLTIPTWPQLPKRSFKEGMLVQYGEGFPGIVVDDKNKRVWVERNDVLLDQMAAFYENIMSEDLGSFAISGQYADGFQSFIDSLKKNKTKLPLVKGQVTGVFTYGLGLNDNDLKAVWFDEQYRDIVVQGLKKKALWQIAQLKEFADTVIIFFDEPILSALGTPAYMGIQDEDVVAVLNDVAEAIHSEGAMVGVHCCGNMNWSLLTQSAIDIIAFDAYGYGDKIGLYPDAVNRFLERGGYLAWGIVPTGSAEDIHKETQESLQEKIDGLLALYIRKGMSEERLRNQMFFTPSCGMGNLSTSDAERVLQLLESIHK